MLKLFKYEMRKTLFPKLVYFAFMLIVECTPFFLPFCILSPALCISPSGSLPFCSVRLYDLSDQTERRNPE